MKASVQDIQTLRGRTQAGVLDCKKALEACDGDMEKAVAWLRESGVAKVAKKQDRIAAEGIVDAYIHLGGKIGVLVEVNSETDFVARGDKFKELVHNLCLQVAAAKPLYVSRSDVPADAVEKEREIYRQQCLNDEKNKNKPAKVIDMIVENKLNKFYQEVCLLEQPYFRDESKTIQDLVNEASMVLGEKLSVRRFARFEMGEGLEKKTNDLAAEVAKERG